MPDAILAGCDERLLASTAAILAEEGYTPHIYTSGPALMAAPMGDFIVFVGNLSDQSAETAYFHMHQHATASPWATLFLSIDHRQQAHLRRVGVARDSIYNGPLTPEDIATFLHKRAAFYREFIETLQFRHYFSGLMQEMGLSELFFLIAHYQKSGILNLRGQAHWELFFRHGQLVHALSDQKGTVTRDFQALFRLFSEAAEQEVLSFEFMGDVEAPEVTLREPITSLIARVFQMLEQQRIPSLRDTLMLPKARITQTDVTQQYKKVNMIMGNETMDKAIEIGANTYWVSQRDPNSLLQTNTFLRVFRHGDRTINLLIDPGPLEFFSTISRKVGSLIGDISRVNMYSINHQDPDVGMNSTFIARMNPKSVCLCTEDTWRLVKFFELPKQSFKNVYGFQNHQVSLATSRHHVLEFVPTPYCHFVGAFAIYDRETRILYTGDLFGGLSPAGNLSLVATEEHWEGIKLFHQIYMPSKKAVQNAIDNIRALPEPPLMIVPQHGAVLAGQVMENFLQRLYNLDMGMDLFEKGPENALIPSYLELISLLYERFVAAAGASEAERLFHFGDRNQELFYLTDLQLDGIRTIYSQPEQALNALLSVLCRYEDRGLVNELKSLAVKEALLRRLPMPMAHLYDDGGAASASPFIAAPEEDVFAGV